MLLGLQFINEVLVELTVTHGLRYIYQGNQLCYHLNSHLSVNYNIYIEDSDGLKVMTTEQGIFITERKIWGGKIDKK